MVNLGYVYGFSRRRVSNLDYNQLIMSHLSLPIYIYYTNNAEFKMYHPDYQLFTKIILIELGVFYCFNYILYSFIPVKS